MVLALNGSYASAPLGDIALEGIGPRLDVKVWRRCPFKFYLGKPEVLVFTTIVVIMKIIAIEVVVVVVVVVMQLRIRILVPSFNVSLCHKK